MQSWRSIFTTGLPMRFRVTELSVAITGDVARVHNVENIYVGDDPEVLGRVAVTHIFLRRDGAWALVLHHGSPIASEEPAPPPPVASEFH
jgi:ketosteroid isomerase-like protein